MAKSAFRASLGGAARLLLVWVLWTGALWVVAADPAAADEKPLALALGIAAGQGGEYVDAARSVADALSLELAQADEFEILFFDAENPTIKRAVLEGRLKSDMLAGIANPEVLRTVLSQLGARFGIDIALDTITSDGESLRVDLSIELTDLADPEEHRLTASGSAPAGESYLDALGKAATAAGVDAAGAIRREIASLIQSSGGFAGRERVRELGDSARAKLAAGDAPGALDDLEAACHIDPKDPGLRALKAEAHEAGGQIDRAIIEGRRAVYLDDSSAEYRLLLGKLYLENKEADRAVSELKEAIRLGLDSHEVRISLGEAYMSQGLTVQAEEHFRVAADLAPRDLQATLSLGKVYERSRSSEAEALYRAYLAGAESPEVRLRLAAVLVKKKNYQEALTELRVAANQPDADFSALESYGLCASVIDHEVTDVANQFRVAAFEYGDERITRQVLYDRSGQLLERSQRVRDLAERITPSEELERAHGHRRYGTELLVQAAINFQSYIETDKAYMRDQYDLLHNEAIKEIAAAKQAHQ